MIPLCSIRSGRNNFGGMGLKLEAGNRFYPPLPQRLPSVLAVQAAVKNKERFGMFILLWGFGIFLFGVGVGAGNWELLALGAFCVLVARVSSGGTVRLIDEACSTGRGVDYGRE